MGQTEAIDRVCESFYDIGPYLPRWIPVLDKLSTVLRGAACSLHLLRHDRPECSFIGGVQAEVAEEYAERFLYREPRSQFLRSAIAGEVATDLDVASPESMRASEFYRDFLPRNGLGACIFSAPVHTPTDTAYFGLDLPAGAPPPDKFMIDAVRHVQPHLNRAIRAQLHLLDAQSHKSAHFEAFDHLRVGVVIVGEGQKILLANKIAEDLLSDGEVLYSRERRLSTIRSDEMGRLSMLIASAAARTGDAGGAAIFGAMTRTPVSVTVVPASAALRDETGAAAIVFAAPGDAGHTRDRQRVLQDLFGLTAAEARIANLLAAGHSMKRIADELELTYETIRSVIKHVFMKTGARRQAELVALIHTATPVVIDSPDAQD